MANMTKGQLEQAAKNPKREPWTEKEAKEIHEIEVYRVTCKRHFQKYPEDPLWVVNHLNNNFTSYARLVHIDDDEVIFDWVVASCNWNYFGLWGYLERNLREYRVEKITSE